MEDIINLKCEKCGCDYEKPSIYQEYLIQSKYNVFYKWSLSFCDECRREKEMGALKSLPDILKKLSEYCLTIMDHKGLILEGTM